ncbi:MAG: hypothetical protein GY701_23855, partial [Sulfitobacter sp.]|nr:hypothetical protein [Sulfitobacter sp.]
MEEQMPKTRSSRSRLLRGFLFLAVLGLAIFSSSLAFAWHTYIVANVSGLMVRFQLTVSLPDCTNYQINWGDGSTSGTFTLLSSGTTSYYHTYAAAGTYNAFLLCGGVADPAYSVTVPPAAPDVTPPTISITSPAIDPFTTTVPTAILSGTASDNVGVTQVAWSNTTTGASGVAAGTAAWTAAGIPLQAGANSLVVTARDAAFNADTDTLTVNYTPPGPAFTVTAVPPTGTAVPGRNNVFSITYRASGAGSLTATSPRGTFETSGGSVLGSVESTVTLRVVNGLGLVGDSVNLPAAVIAAALDRASNRIFYRRTFNGTVQTAVAFQVLPASAGPLSVKRMELNFLFTDETGRIEKSPRATVPRNSGNLRAVVDLQYDGGGTLRGVWKVDGQILGYTAQTLYRGVDSVAIESPAVPQLPTYAAGRHSVAFEIEDPPPGFDEPVIHYYVSERAGGGIGGDLVLIEPAPGAAVPMPVGSEKDSLFKWQADPRQVVYRFELVSPLNLERPIVQAVTRENKYRLSRYDGEQIAAGVDYLWRVIALSGETPVASSTYRPVYVSVRPGGAAGLTLSNFSVVDAGGGIPAGEGPGLLPLFQLQTGGPVRVATLLENASGREAQNITVQVLLDGALYDALFFQRLAPGDVQEIFSDLELAEARRQTLQVRAFEEGREGAAATIGGAIEGAAGFSGPADGVFRITTDRLQMTGLAVGAPLVRAETLQMTGLAVGSPLVRTETLQMTGLALGSPLVRTETLQMTGLAAGAPLVRTETLQMTGHAVGAPVVTTEPLEMTGLAVNAPVVRSGALEMAGLSPASAIRIVQPNGGEQWLANDAYP